MKVIKNYLENSIFKEIQTMVFSSHFPLYYNDYVADLSDHSDFMFTHYFYANEKQNSDFMSSIILPILGKLKYKKLIRAKLNCYTKKNKHIYTPFHKDLDYAHQVALFSLNTCNGFTYFKEKNKKIKSIENQMVLFDGLKEHASVNQTDTNLRMNININYTI